MHMQQTVVAAPTLAKIIFEKSLKRCGKTGYSYPSVPSHADSMTRKFFFLKSLNCLYYCIRHLNRTFHVKFGRNWTSGLETRLFFGVK